MARDIGTDGTGLHLAMIDGKCSAQIDLCNGTPGLEALIGRVACGGKLRLRGDDRVSLRIVDDDIRVAAGRENALARVRAIESGGVFGQQARTSAPL